MVAEKATLQLLIARSLFAYLISYSRGPQRIRISHMAFARPLAYSHFAYRIRAIHNLLHTAYQ